MPSIATTTRQFNPVSLMIILFFLCLTLLKVNELDPLNFTRQFIFPNLLFWIATLAVILLFASIFSGNLREWIAKYIGLLAWLYFFVYIMNWPIFL